MLETILYTIVGSIVLGATIGFIVGDILGFRRGIKEVEADLSCHPSLVTRHATKEQI